MKVNLKYKIGQKIKASERIYEIIGFEWIKERGIRYALLHVKDGKTEWEFMYEFEIKAII